jgi:hypothetical protein
MSSMMTADYEQYEDSFSGVLGRNETWSQKISKGKKRWLSRNIVDVFCVYNCVSLSVKHE